MKDAMQIQGKFIIEVIRDGKVISKEEVPNVVTIEGRNYFLKVGITGDENRANFYVGLIGANVTPTENDTASSNLGSSGSYQEIQSYSQTTRPAYQGVFSNNTVSNVANPAQFSINASVTAYGAFIVSNNTKGSNSGILLCAGRFASAKSLNNGDTINITYSIASTS